MKKEELLNLYKNYSDDEIRDFLISGIEEYKVIEVSERIASNLLNRYGMNFYMQHENFKNNIKRLMLCARIRGIYIPTENISFDITKDDIIERIRENEVLDIEEYKDIPLDNVYETIVSKVECMLDEGRIIR